MSAPFDEAFLRIYSNMDVSCFSHESNANILGNPSVDEYEA